MAALGRATVLAAVTFLLVAGGAAAAPAQAPGTTEAPGTTQAPDGRCRTRARPAARITEVPWAQRWFDPERAWAVSAGAGVTVAVVDTGVDATHPQLGGERLRQGTSLVGGIRGDIDCDAHGTAVASLIAARNEPGIGLTGLAPEAALLPVRVAEGGIDNGAGTTEPIDAARVAAGIEWAVDNGAEVINLSVALYRPEAAVERAVRRALDAGVVVVAAVGNERREGGGPDPVPYPAAYDGVLGVGAIDANGVAIQVSPAGSFVDLVAPGADVTVAALRDGHELRSGTSFAAAFVSAAAALLVAAEPGLTPEEVGARLVATADPPAGDRARYGHGVVNPYRALAERTGGGEPLGATPVQRPSVDAGEQARAARWDQVRRVAVIAAAVVLGLGVLAAAGLAAFQRGRRRGWAPARWAGPPGRPPDAAKLEEPQRTFYEVPTPRPADERERDRPA